MNANLNPPYSLFHDVKTGRWGTKDKNGNIQFRPIYIRSSVAGKENIFHDEAGLVVIEFNPKTGMDVVAWCSEPWYDSAWSVAHYPDEYDDYLWQNIHSKTSLGLKHIETLKKVKSTVNLTPQQNSLFDLFSLFLEFEDEETEDDKWDELERVILAHPLIQMSADERMELVLPLMESSELSDDEKSLLWYALFRLNDYISYQ